MIPFRGSDNKRGFPFPHLPHLPPLPPIPLPLPPVPPLHLLDNRQDSLINLRKPRPGNTDAQEFVPGLVTRQIEAVPRHHADLPPGQALDQTLQVDGERQLELDIDAGAVRRGFDEAVRIMPPKRNVYRADFLAYIALILCL